MVNKNAKAASTKGLKMRMGRESPSVNTPQIVFRSLESYLQSIY